MTLLLILKWSVSVCGHVCVYTWCVCVCVCVCVCAYMVVCVCVSECVCLQACNICVYMCMRAMFVLGRGSAPKECVCQCV